VVGGLPYKNKALSSSLRIAGKRENRKSSHCKSCTGSWIFNMSVLLGGVLGQGVTHLWVRE
jgi:hypothetical protein